MEGEANDKLIVPLIFINFIENSFKHSSTSTSEKKGYVSLEVKINENNLNFLLENSKSESSNVGSNNLLPGGIGLANVKNRLELVYPGQYDLRIHNEPHRFIVELEILLDQNARITPYQTE